MSDVLIAEVRLVEKYKLAIPEIKRMLEFDSFYYMAGTLVLSGITDPVTGMNLMTIDIHPIGDTNSKIIQKGQYLASQIFVKHKKETCYSYELAVSNIKEYEKAHGRELEPSGTGVIN